MRIGRAAIAAMTMMLLTAVSSWALTTRIKDIASVSGVTKHTLMGYGLVVGLEGTGDGTGAGFTAQSLANMLERFGVSVSSGQIKVKNVAAVMVTADLPADCEEGSQIDVLLSSIGDAKSLQGGTLLATPLRGGDGDVYALGQGPVSIGGFNYSSGGDSVQKNHAVVGRVARGAHVTQAVESRALEQAHLCLLLHNPDYTTASRVAEAIGEQLGQGAAWPVNETMVQVSVPGDCPNMVELITGIEQLTVQPDSPATVVINERTGTVVIGEHVRIAPVAIAHGSLTIQVSVETQVSQPGPFAGGDTAVVNNEEITVSEGGAGLVALPAQGSLHELVSALNMLGVKPRDLIAIIQALQTAGALEAEVTVQ